ncbi:unnamed protein product [Penicillium salamii]|uniref:Hemolysin-III channel protein Izh2 n=1 Tax=Penicillium salamii TaxID=1612424 RepID=A0A9W4JWV4_9EURO|nr:unnamed protein product [Penicillium salamii]CAG8405552.1 unnamed protein product [Penicillium salamii]CAG8426770.1 unnamed protein product [Penicillium salamii]
MNPNPTPRQRKTSPFPPIARSELSLESSSEKQSTLLSYDELPEWYQDNEFIHHGYRPVSRSIRACISSWLALHTETVNIYSHLIPAILFTFVEAGVFGYLQIKYPQATLGDQFIFAIFLQSATICLGFSAAYHTLMNHSHAVCGLWLQFDFVGIIVLTIGKFISGINMVFYCERTLKQVYWAMILTLGLLTISILLNPKFSGRSWRTFRVCAFVATGLSGFAPLAHGIKIFGFSQMAKQSGMPYYLVEGILLVLGAVVYATRVPESLMPGKFNIFGSSHQIFHILVVLATGVHFLGILNAFDYNYHHRSCGLL